MGSIVKNPSYVRIIVSAIANSNNDKIKKIEIFSNNDKLICSKNFDSNFTKVDFTLPPPNKNTYYLTFVLLFRSVLPVIFGIGLVFNKQIIYICLILKIMGHGHS